MGSVCACGCGLAARSRFLRGHNNRLPEARERMTRAPLRWKGARTPHGAGYVTVCDGRGRHQLEHIVIAEKALGRRLPKGAEVHHVNEIRTDNRGANLVICPSHKYHILLHQRASAYDACGYAHWRRCGICEQYDDPLNLYIRPNGFAPVHRTCRKERNRA